MCSNEELQNLIEKNSTKIDDLVKAVEELQKQVSGSNGKSLLVRVEVLETIVSEFRWLARIIVAAVILEVIAFIFILMAR